MQCVEVLHCVTICRMFKTDLSVRQAFQKLLREHGWAFTMRGFRSNMIAVAIPITATIFITDVLISLKKKQRLDH